MSENTKYDTNIALQSDLEKNHFVTPALYANEVAITAQSETVQTTSDDEVIVIDQSNKATSNIDAPDGNTNIKVGSGYNVINVNDGNSTITAAGNAYNIITIGNANTNIAVGGGQNKITAGDGNNNITTTGNGISTITLGDGINTISGGNGNHTITIGNGGTSNEQGQYNDIYLGSGNNDITTGTGYNYIFAGTGYEEFSEEYPPSTGTVPGTNKLTTSKGGHTVMNVGRGNAIINSQGNDTILAAYDAFNTDDMNAGHFTHQVTLAGGNSLYTGVSSAYITDLSSNNSASVGSNSVIIAGDQGNYIFAGYNNDAATIDSSTPNLNSHDLLVNATNSSISSRTDLTIQGGNGNNIESSGNLIMSDITGHTSLTTTGSFTINGTDGLNMDVSSYNLNDDSSLENIFMAGSGNETLNASLNNNDGLPTSSLAIYADTISGAQSSLVAIAGNGDDTLTAGTGNSTFTGGAGENLFAFTKADAAGGNTVITDFSASEDNQIALFDYGLTRSSLSKLLKSSQNDAQGDAVLHLENHTITLQGVSVSDLSTNQFFVYNSK